MARRAGFERPILHGLCTYGIAARAIMERLCDHDPTRIYALDERFTAPVLPGETIVTALSRHGDTVSFRCRGAGRDMLADRWAETTVGEEGCSTGRTQGAQ